MKNENQLEIEHYGLYQIGRIFCTFRRKRRPEEPITERVSNGYQAFVPLSELAKDIADNISLSGDYVERRR